MSELSLVEKRLALRRQIAEQRAVIVLRLTPARLGSDPLVQGSLVGNSLVGNLLGAFAPRSTYPRSLTMRWLLKNPATVTKLTERATTWLLGARYSGVLKDSMQFLKMVRAGATLR